jgi:hypothetical protein
VRRFPRVYPVTLNAVGMTAAALVLLAASRITGNPFVLPQGIETWLAIGYLVVIGSIVVYLLDAGAPALGGDARRVRVRDHPVRDCSAVRMARRQTGHPRLGGGRAPARGGVHLGALRSGMASRFLPPRPADVADESRLTPGSLPTGRQSCTAAPRLPCSSHSQARPARAGTSQVARSDAFGPPGRRARKWVDLPMRSLAGRPSLVQTEVRGGSA